MTDAPVRPATLGDLSGGAPLLVLAPHPDDESLGCGALLAAAFEGPGAHVVCMTDGGASHAPSPDWPRTRLATLRAAELEAAVAALGGTRGDITRLDLPDAGMEDMADSHDAIAARIVSLARQTGARTLVAPSARDPHCDHVATAAIAARAAALGALRHLSYAIWSRWRGDAPEPPACRFDTAPQRARKARAIACHRSQLGCVAGLDPGGFRMAPDFVALFRDHDEIFSEVAP